MKTYLRRPGARVFVGVTVSVGVVVGISVAGQVDVAAGVTVVVRVIVAVMMVTFVAVGEGSVRSGSEPFPHAPTMSTCARIGSSIAASLRTISNTQLALVL